MKIPAYAKLNLTLDVLDRREDGYHNMSMVMQSVDLADAIIILPNGSQEMRVQSNLDFLPTGEKNLAAVAAQAFYRTLRQAPKGLDIVLDKHIPVCAGLGGGSSDAAAVLRALNSIEGNPLSPEQLIRVGEQVGSDVPYCIQGGTALAQSRGEVLTLLPSLPLCWVTVCKPDFSVSTAELFRRIDGVKLRRRPDTAGVLAALEAGELEGVARRMYNVFEDALPPRQHARVTEVKSTMIQCGALGANMSGTGSAAFGLFAQRQAAQSAAELLSQRYRDVFVCQTV